MCSKRSRLWIRAIQRTFTWSFVRRKFLPTTVNPEGTEMTTYPCSQTLKCSERERQIWWRRQGERLCVNWREVLKVKVLETPNRTWFESVKSWNERETSSWGSIKWCIIGHEDSFIVASHRDWWTVHQGGSMLDERKIRTLCNWLSSYLKTSLQ